MGSTRQIAIIALFVVSVFVLSRISVELALLALVVLTAVSVWMLSKKD